MTTACTSVAPTWQSIPTPAYAEADEVSIWAEVSTWLALFMTLFISVGGGIKLHYAPIAFGLADSSGISFKQLAVKILGLGAMALLMPSHFRGILRVCLNARSFLLLPAIAFASVFWSQSGTQTIVQSTSLALTTLFAIFLFVRFPGERLISFLTVSAAFLLLGCACAVAFFPNVGIDAFQQDAWRGIFSQRNNCAVDCVCFLVLGLHYRPRQLAGVFVRGIVIFLSLVFIVMSASRTGWLVAAFAIALTYGLQFVQRMQVRERLVFLMSLSIPVGIFILVLASNFDQFLTLIGKDPTMSQRTVIWATVLLPIARHPFVGYGYSAFWLGLTGESANTILVTGWAENQAQSGYLDVLLQLGLLGFVPFVLMLVRGLVKAVRRIGPLNTRPVQLATVLLLVLIVENIGESGFLAPLNMLWFYTLLCLLILEGSRKVAEEA